MAHAMDLCVIAEGVETDEQLRELRVLGCDLAQGFLFCRPVSPDEISRGWTGTSLGAINVRAIGRGESDVVLVVDDTADVRQLARVSLSAAGFEVVEAVSGREALAMARQLRPVCVLLDVSMPGGMSGLQVCRELRADPATAACTIVMLTGNASAEDKVAAFSAGADDYMVKPFAPRDVVGRVRSAINRRRDAEPDSFNVVSS
jgi:CheY-like chemotaxis protein